EINFPSVLTGVEVDRVQRSPWRRDRRIPVRIEKSAVAGEAIFHVVGRRLRARGFFLWRAGQEIDKFLHLIFSKAGKSVHAAFASANRARDLRGREAVANAYKR